MDNRKYLPVVITIAIAIIIIISVSNSLFFTVQAGERAVMFRKFSGGLDKENVIGPGFNFKAPWNDVYIYDVTENQIEETLDVLDKNGLNINVDVTVRFHPMYDSIGEIYETFQRDYVRRLVVPEVRSTVRQVMGRFTAEEIYSTKRPEVEAAIRTETENILGAAGNNIEMRALLIRSIKLPEQIRLAIENKLKQEQEALAYQFKLEKEKSEAERKRIAAEGESTANKIINSSLTKELLKMRGIEATQDLANSQNTKIIVIGNGESGLPLILGGD
ncbi:prohibitin family protein [Marinoscillum sp. MHG1-6]|uniref:prohibitin family protein n=1 Tax=Marinoscillum sp. MHG1-6 TaxID=2959627 RepID=UPI0021572FA7|nr:prohibitin family protein [Marinoscillum sp. MHG1-6]